MCALVDLGDLDLVVGLAQDEVAAVREPVHDVEDEEQAGHGHQEEPVHVDVIFPTEIPFGLLIQGQLV